MKKTTRAQEIVELAAALKPHGGTLSEPEPRNSCNSWGFGGMIGTYQRGVVGDYKFTIKRGKLYYCHLSPRNIDEVQIEFVRGAWSVPEFTKILLRGGTKALQEEIDLAARDGNL